MGKLIIFDDLDFQSFKLLSAVYLKLLDLDINSRFLLRIKGAYRRAWTENQLLLTHLKDLFSASKTAQIEFVIADESIRLTEIYKDPSIFFPQNFLIGAPLNRKKDFCRKLAENLWEICSDEIEKTQWKKDKTLSLHVLWKSGEEFAAQLENAETILIKDDLQPILCAEEQILNLCANEFLIFGDEKSNWQLIVSALFKVRKINRNKLIFLAEKRGLAHQSARMLEKLTDDFGAKIPADLPNNLRQTKKTRKPFLIKQKIQNLR